MKYIVCYGGGTNSTAMLVGLFEKGIVPSAILFADTGGEKPNTYTHIVSVNKWCEKVGFPLIETLSGVMPRQIADGTLEQECLRLGSLPAKAYGFSSCSAKWKVDPQNRYIKNFIKINNLNPSDVIKLIGFDADEISRVERGKRASENMDVRQDYPLYNWEWGRDECVAAINRAGLPQPGKSACFFWPSSKKHEIITLSKEYPSLARRAIQMERKALSGGGTSEATTSFGLGRSFSWEKLLLGQIDMFDYGIPELDCACYDG